MFNCVQVDSETKKITAVSTLKNNIDKSNVFKVEDINTDYIGQYFNEQTGEITPEPPTNEASA